MECLFLPAKLRDSRVGARKKGEKENGGCLADCRIVLCGEYSSTCRRVLEYLPQSTLADSARRVAASGKAVGGQVAVGHKKSPWRENRRGENPFIQTLSHCCGII